MSFYKGKYYRYILTTQYVRTKNMHLNNVICAWENIITILYITVNFTVGLGFFLVRWQLSGDATLYCTTIHRYPIFSTRYSVMCKVYTGHCGTSEIEHGLCACTER